MKTSSPVMSGRGQKASIARGSSVSLSGQEVTGASGTVGLAAGRDRSIFRSWRQD